MHLTLLAYYLILDTLSLLSLLLNTQLLLVYAVSLLRNTLSQNSTHSLLRSHLQSHRISVLKRGGSSATPASSQHGSQSSLSFILSWCSSDHWGSYGKCFGKCFGKVCYVLCSIYSDSVYYCMQNQLDVPRC